MDVMKTLALKSALLIAKIEADKLKDNSLNSVVYTNGASTINPYLPEEASALMVSLSIV